MAHCVIAVPGLHVCTLWGLKSCVSVVGLITQDRTWGRWDCRSHYCFQGSEGTCPQCASPSRVREFMAVQESGLSRKIRTAGRENLAGGMALQAGSGARMDLILQGLAVLRGGGWLFHRFFYETMLIKVCHCPRCCGCC